MDYRRESGRRRPIKRRAPDDSHRYRPAEASEALRGLQGELGGGVIDGGGEMNALPHLKSYREATVAS